MTETERRRTAAAYALRVLMSDISETAYAASWMSGIEDALWDLVMRRDTDGGGYFLGMSELGTFELDALSLLSDLAGGWWCWERSDPPNQQRGPRLLPLDEWRARVASGKGASDDRT